MNVGVNAGVVQPDAGEGALSLVTDWTPQLFDGCASLLDCPPACASGPARARCDPRSSGLAESVQPFGQPRERHLTIGRLRAALARGDHDAARAVGQPHAGRYLVTMLPARPTGDKKAHVAVALECVPVERVGGWQLNTHRSSN